MLLSFDTVVFLKLEKQKQVEKEKKPTRKASVGEEGMLRGESIQTTRGYIYFDGYHTCEL